MAAAAVAVAVAVTVAVVGYSAERIGCIVCLKFDM